MSTTIPMSEIYATIADGFAGSGNFTPTHCDVRCAVNDLLDGLERDGHDVRHDYNQNRAFRQVRRLLGGKGWKQ